MGIEIVPGYVIPIPSSRRIKQLELYEVHTLTCDFVQHGMIFEEHLFLCPLFRAAGKEKNDSLPKDGIEALVVDMPVAKTVQIQAKAGQKTKKQTARPFRPLFCVARFLQYYILSEIAQGTGEHSCRSGRQD